MAFCIHLFWPDLAEGGEIRLVARLQPLLHGLEVNLNSGEQRSQANAHSD